VIGVAHEAFLSAWPPPGQAITAAAPGLRSRRAIERAAEQWARLGRRPARLLERGPPAGALADTGARLRAGRTADGIELSPGGGSASRRPRGRRILVADRVELSGRAREFLTASIRRDRRRRGRAVTILSALLVLALGLAAFAFDRQRAAEDRQLLATARQLLAQAETRLDQDPRTALRLNEAAVHVHDSPETRSALTNSLLATRYAGTLGHTGPIWSVAFAPDGNTLASAGAEGVRLWNTSDPAAPTPLGSPLPGHDPGGGVAAVAFAPDGSLLASAGADGVRLWNISDPAAASPLGSPLPDSGGVYEVAFAADGSLLATAGEDGVRLWSTSDPTTSTPLGSPLPGSDSRGVAAVAFASDDSLLASAGADGTVRLWNLADPTAPTPLGDPLAGHDDWVTGVAFAPHQPLLASADTDGTVQLWNLSGLVKLRDHAIERACTITGGGLTRDQWESFVSGIEYDDICET